MKNIENTLYSQTHEWVYLNTDNIATIGITEQIIQIAGKITFIEFIEKGAYLNKGETFATIETIKGSEELYTPIKGSVIEVNKQLINSPELINKNTENIWLIKIKPSSFIMDSNDLLDFKSYKNL